MPGRTHNTPRHARRAFTLVEIIVVVTIIAVLAALIAPRLFGRLTWAKVRTAEAEVQAMETAVNLYLNDTGETLTSSFDLEVLLVPAEEGGGPQGPYFQKAVSWGPDAQENTDDDIVN